MNITQIVVPIGKTVYEELNSKGKGFFLCEHKDKQLQSEIFLQTPSGLQCFVCMKSDDPDLWKWLESQIDGQPKGEPKIVAAPQNVVSESLFLKSLAILRADGQIDYNKYLTTK